ncbi:MAG: UDP-N-acetylmuramoyl-L-alanyl-D-glutamate--2,6-diaminopimelate ligase [Bacteroidetes bacterium]|nr:UDP-N-acetylmuramoyl-L-alanyl-D-glutamate--2,6-diaminopimelate ligase [Bacteroidota bacterium]
MPNFLALLRHLPHAEVHGDPDVMVLDVASDSREVQPGWLFVAIRGEQFDGHDAIADAINSGATVVIGDLPLDKVRFKGPQLAIYVRVDDTRLALARIVHAILDEPSRGLRIYGVTGTNGKTTCATILEQLFTSVGLQAGFIGTTGIRYDGRSIEATHTTPHARALCEFFSDMKAHRTEVVSMEVSSHALDQYRVGGIDFAGAIFTNLTHDHLDYHGTMERYADAKKKLFDGLSPSAVAVVWGDDVHAAHMVRNCKARRIIRVGEQEHNNVRVCDVEVGAHGTRFTLVLPGKHVRDGDMEVHLATPLIGRFNVANAALCAVMAMQEGVKAADVKVAMQTVRGPAGRMERYALINGAVAVVDYAHTPDALQKALDVLREILPSRARLHVVFGCGGDRDAAKRPVMGAIAARLADEVWVTSDNPRTEDPGTIIDDIGIGIAQELKGEKAEWIHTISDRRAAIAAALDHARPHDIVLIAGKGHETVQVVGAERRHHSDVEEVARWNQSKRT